MCVPLHSHTFEGWCVVTEEDNTSQNPADMLTKVVTIEAETCSASVGFQGWGSGVGSHQIHWVESWWITREMECHCCVNNQSSSREIVKLWSLIIVLIICCPIYNHYADRHARSDRCGVGKGRGAPETKLLWGQSTSGKEVGRVRSFRLRARSESRFGVAAWYHSGGALRSESAE